MNIPRQTAEQELLAELIQAFAELPQVVALGRGGSRNSQWQDDHSDVDLIVFVNKPIALDIRENIAESRGTLESNVGLAFWDPGDEWIDQRTGLEIDLIYWDLAWISGDIDRVLDRQEAWLGYSTCFLYTLQNLDILYDRYDWLAKLKYRCCQPYPEALRQNIIARNYPLLKSVIPAYRNQLDRASKREDYISVNHRLAALLAGYFDIVFAVNRQAHPGEKRLLSKAVQLCSQLPQNFEKDLNTLLNTSPSDSTVFLFQLDLMLEHLDKWLIDCGFDLQKLSNFRGWNIADCGTNKAYPRK